MATVHPTATYHHSEAEIVIIQMRTDRYSCGILNDKKNEVWFPWDFDEEDLHTAKDTAERLCRGYWGTLEDFRAKHKGYTMQYPIQDGASVSKFII